MGAVGTIEIRTSAIGELQEHAGAAIEQNHSEAGHGTLSVDWPRLHLLENAGLAIVLAAWLEDLIVGYSVAFILDQINNGERYCLGHVIFVLPEYRKGGDLGRRLLRATEGAADAHGCVNMVWQSFDDGPLAKILRRIGYTDGERLYMKQLDGATEGG